MFTRMNNTSSAKSIFMPICNSASRAYIASRPRLPDPYLRPVPTSLIDIAASVHGDHLTRAERALARGDLKVFWLHSRICDTCTQALDELRAIPADVSKTENVRADEGEHQNIIT